VQPLDGSAFLLVVGFMCLLAAIITTAWWAWNEVGNALRLRRWRAERPDWSPSRYPGCIECEGAESLGARYLLRHQAYDHENGVRPW
jgi:hypothetical protein